MAVKRRYINDAQEKKRNYNVNANDLRMDRNMFTSPRGIERKEGVNNAYKMQGSVDSRPEYRIRNGIRQPRTAFEEGNTYFDPGYRAENGDGNAKTKESQAEKQRKKVQRYNNAIQSIIDKKKKNTK